MIELVFAIVIIAITVVSLPMMSQVILRNSENALVQEAIFAAITELNEVTSYKWDANSADSNVSASYVVNVDGDCNAAFLRPGHIAQLYHRKCLSDPAITSAANISSTTTPNLHNMAHSSSAVFLGNAATKEGYKNAYFSTLTVTPNSSFGSLSNDPNIKKISISISDSSGSVVTRLDAYSFNIGEIDVYKRSL